VLQRKCLAMLVLTSLIGVVETFYVHKGGLFRDTARAHPAFRATTPLAKSVRLKKPCWTTAMKEEQEDEAAHAVLIAGSRRSIVQSLILGLVAGIKPGCAASAPPPVPSEAVFQPGGAVLAAQRAAADAERDVPQSVGEVRILSFSDAEAMLQLTRAQRWDNTLLDLQLLLGMSGSRVFGIFSSSAQLVSMCAITHFPSRSGVGAAFLSYVITRKDFRRRGLARQTCTASLNWLDTVYPSCSIGLYGEPTESLILSVLCYIYIYMSPYIYIYICMYTHVFVYIHMCICI